MAKRYDVSKPMKKSGWPNTPRRDAKFADLIRGVSKTASFRKDTRGKKK